MRSSRAQLCGERTRLACWFRRRAETIFVLNSFPRATDKSYQKSAIARTRSPARETRGLPRPRCTALKEFQARQILRINNADRHAVIIDHDQVIDAMTFQQIKNFHCELVFVHRDRV
jgi:hypothetical protein